MSHPFQGVRYLLILTVTFWISLFAGCCYFF